MLIVFASRLINEKKTSSHTIVNKIPSKFKLKTGITDLPVDAFAEHLTYMEVTFFAKVTSTDLRNHCPKNRPKSISMWADRYNTVDMWLTKQLQGRESAKEKVNLVIYLIKLCKKLFVWRNFNTIMQISGVFSNLLREEVWSLIPPKLLEQWKEIEELMSARFNFKNYRNSVKEALDTNKPVVPFLALHLKDLTYIAESLTDAFEQDKKNKKGTSKKVLVSFDNMQMTGRAIVQLLRLKHFWKNSTFNINTELFDFIQDF